MIKLISGQRYHVCGLPARLKAAVFYICGRICARSHFYRKGASRQKHQASCRCISSTRSFPMLSPASTSLPTGLPETRGTDKIRSVCACPTPEGRPEYSDVPRPGILVAGAPGELEPSAGAGMSRKECGAPLEARCVSLHPILSATHCHTCQSPPKPRRYSKRDANVTWMQAP